MSALRLPGPDGRTILHIIDDGAVGRISHTRYGIRPVVHGSFVVGVTKTAARSQAEYKAREKAREATP